jgi:hypothetical protein
MSNPLSILRPVTVALVFGCVFCTLLPGSVRAQHNAEKAFKQRDYNPIAPVKIINISVANKPVKLGETFNAGDDWLRGTEIRLKNVSDKDVIYVDLDFAFPETLSSGNEMMFISEFGNLPGLPILHPPFLLKPNEEIPFTFSDEEYKSLVKFVGYRTQIANINRADLLVRFVVFADLTAWAAGLRFKQEPGNPRRWIPIENQAQP